jgi:hypothetical protein
MKIKRIQYPDGVQLNGWDKFVFERRIKSCLKSFYSVCDLDRCRLAVLGQERDEDRYEELSAFHCISFKNMGNAEVQSLVEKTGQYVGIEITTQRISRAPSIVVALLSGIIIGAVCAWMIPLVNAQRGAKAPAYAGHLVDVPRESVLPLVRQSPLPVPVFDPDEAPESVFDTTVRTNQPATTARTLANAVRNEVGEFDVSLTVTQQRPKRPILAGSKTK